MCGIVHFITWATRALIAASLVSAVLTTCAISAGSVNLFCATTFITPIVAVFLSIASPDLGNANARLLAFKFLSRTRVLLLHKWITGDLIRPILAVDITVTLPEFTYALITRRTYIKTTKWEGIQLLQTNT